MIQLEIFGTPRPGGGKIGGFNHRTGKGFVRPDNPRTAEWRSDVVAQSLQQYSGDLLDGAVVMHYEFKFSRPKKHFNSKGELRADAPYWHTTKPDLTKVIRSTEDALTGIVWTDDCRVARRTEAKRYCNGAERPGVSMIISEMTE